VSNIQGKTTHGEKQPMREEAFRVRGNGKRMKWKRRKQVKGRRMARGRPTLCFKAYSNLVFDVSI
jgi:hypothetical protein